MEKGDNSSFNERFVLIIFFKSPKCDELVKSITDGARRKCPWVAK